jgi:hypothetical protein
MTLKEQLTTQLNIPSLIKKMVIGWFIALVLISLFLYSANPNPAWGQYYFIRPLIITPLAGAMGGLFFYIMDPMSVESGWKRFVASFICFIVYMIGLWLGFVLGLDGTYWD